MIGRRRFLGRAAAALVATGSWPQRTAAEPAPETTRLRVAKLASVCVSPQYVAADLFRAEGFTDVSYIDTPGGVPGAKFMADGEIDIQLNFAAPLVVAVDAGYPITILTGIHVGCFELFGTERVRTIKDLKGKTVAVFAMDSAQHIFLAAMMTQVGLDPQKDVTWITPRAADAKQMLADGRIDGYLGFPPDPQELRARGIGHIVVNSAVDRPWSQYFCCMLTANRDFVRRHPVAAKRAVRAILKADAICALEPDRAARAVLDHGFPFRAELVTQALKEIPYGRWRDYDPADTLRFYALRLREAGMVKATPQRILSDGADWRLLKEMKKELKT